MRSGINVGILQFSLTALESSMFAGSQNHVKLAFLGQGNSYCRTESGWFVVNIAAHWLGKDRDEIPHWTSSWVYAGFLKYYHCFCQESMQNTSSVFPLGLWRVLNESDSKHKPAVVFVSTVKSQKGVLHLVRLVPCCDSSMHGAGGNVLSGLESVIDGERCTRLSLIKISLSWEMLKRSIRRHHKCKELQSYCRCL